MRVFSSFFKSYFEVYSSAFQVNNNVMYLYCIIAYLQYWNSTSKIIFENLFASRLSLLSHAVVMFTCRGTVMSCSKRQNASSMYYIKLIKKGIVHIWYLIYFWAVKGSLTKTNVILPPSTTIADRSWSNLQPKPTWKSFVSESKIWNPIQNWSQIQKKIHSVWIEIP